MKINEIKQIEGLTVLLGGRTISQDAQGPRSILTTKEERRCAEHIVIKMINLGRETHFEEGRLQKRILWNDSKES